MPSQQLFTTNNINFATKITAKSAMEWTYSLLRLCDGLKKNLIKKISKAERMKHTSECSKHGVILMHVGTIVRALESWLTIRRQNWQF